MRSIICLLFTFQLRKLAVETTEIVCVILGENANILQNMQKVVPKPEILIWKIIIVQKHRESLMTES